MKLGMVIYTADPESAWNAFRLGVFVLKKGDQVKAFLVGKGVECEGLTNEQFKVNEQMQEYIDNGGEIFACGTCLELRNTESTGMCPVSTMQDLYEIISDSDKILSF